VVEESVKRSSLIGAEALISAAILFLATVRLESVPPLWWDEGWTLSVARNWLETGQYKRLLNGHLVPHGLEAAPTLTGTIYLAFKLFGIGVVQARMIAVLYTLPTLLILYYLARRLYNRKIAVATLLILLLTPAYIELVPIYTGRQVLAEMPAMFFLLFGYAAFLLWLPQHCFWISIPILSWSVALGTKAQVLPFWLCSMLIPFGVLLYQKAWRCARYFLFGCTGSLIGSRLLFAFWQHFLWADAASGAVTGLYEVTAVVTSIPARMFALIVLGLFGLPTLGGLCHAAWSTFATKRAFESPVEHVRLSLLALAGSWLAWFVLLSVGWIRYIFPATFISSIFVAAAIYEFTRGFDVTYTVRQSLEIFRGRSVSKQTIGALLVVLLVLTSLPRTAAALYKAYVLDVDTSAQRVAVFLNSQTRPGALVETYDSELFFLLDRPYHYPPDQIHVQLIRRRFLYEDNTVIDYDPLAADPDYLVIGPHSRQWRLYDSILKTGQFHLVRIYKRYSVYERIR
jgi:4-amino-4-deoxy-L-arabinose transferase-like glycosyltransferase